MACGGMSRGRENPLPRGAARGMERDMKIRVALLAAFVAAAAVATAQTPRATPKPARKTPAPITINMGELEGAMETRLRADAERVSTGALVLHGMARQPQNLDTVKYAGFHDEYTAERNRLLQHHLWKSLGLPDPPTVPTPTARAAAVYNAEKSRMESVPEQQAQNAVDRDDARNARRRAIMRGEENATTGPVVQPGRGVQNLDAQATNPLPGSTGIGLNPAQTPEPIKPRPVF